MNSRTHMLRAAGFVSAWLLASGAFAQELQEDFNSATGSPGATILDGSGANNIADFDDGLTGENAFAGTVGSSQVTATAQGTTSGGVGGSGAAQISVPEVTFNLLAQDFSAATGLGGGGFVPTATPDANGFTPMYDTGIFGAAAFGGTFNGAVVNGSISAQGLPLGGVGGTGSAQIDAASISTADWFAGLQFETSALPGATPLLNPGFEDGGLGGGAQDWETFGNVFTESIVNVGLAAHSGEQFMKFFGTFPGDSGIFQSLAAQPTQVWRIDAFSAHVGGDSLVGTGNTVVMKIEFFDTDGMLLLEDEATILAAADPTDIWIDNTALEATAPAGTVEARGVVVFVQDATSGGAGLIDDVSFKIVAGPNPVNIADFELTADIRGTTDSPGEILGDYQLRIEDTDGNRLIFAEAATGSFQSVGGSLDTATEADADGMPAVGVFNPHSPSFTVVAGFENGTWGTGGTLEVDNLFMPSDDPGGSSWFGGLFWDGIAVTETSINDLSLTADILGSIVDGALQLRLECFKSVLSGVDEAFSEAAADGGDFGTDAFLTGDMVAGSQTYGETLAWDSGISGALAFGGVFGDGTSTGGFFARGVSSGGNPGAYGRVRVEDMIFGPGGGWFGGMSWGGQGLASTDLSMVTINADVRGATVSGGSLGEIELRLEDGDGDRLFFCTVATTSWQTIGGTLDSATFGDSFTGGNGQFDLDSNNYTLVVAFSNETSGQLGCDEINSNPWNFGGELQIDNVFLTPAAVDQEIGRVTFFDTSTGAFETVGGNLSAGTSTFGDFEENFTGATATGGVMFTGGEVDNWDDGLEKENAFYGAFGDAVTGDGATAQGCLTCGVSNSRAGQLIASNNPPGTGGWFAGLFWNDVSIDLSAAIDGGQAALTDVFLTADIRGVAGAGETLGTYGLRIEDSDLTGLTFDVTADGTFQAVGGALADAQVVDVDPGTSDGIFNWGQDTYNVTVAVLGTSDNWGPGATITVDNLFASGVSLAGADTCTVAVAFDDEINSWFDSGELTVDNINLTMADNSCETIADCGDADNDGFRDDVCLHYACVDNTCVATPRGVGQSDMGGSFGACDNDGTCDGNDRFLALGCFGNQWPDQACEVSPPAAVNVDAGGAFGSCTLDGVCDGNDAFAALNCFGGDDSCACGGGPAPIAPTSVTVIDRTSVTLEADVQRVRPGALLHVDVYFDGAVSDLRGYQLHVVPLGGDRGHLELVDISVENRKDAAMDAQWQAFNIDKHQVVVGTDAAGSPTAARAYLATFTYRVSRDARGSFLVDLLHDNADPAQRTFVFPTPNRAKIEVSGTTPAMITVVPDGGRLTMKSLQ